MPHKTPVDYSLGSLYHAQRKHLSEQALHCLKLALSVYEPPRSLFDVGCGAGVLIGYCRHKQIDAIGVDIAIPDHDPGWNLFHHDLREPLDLGIAFEWVLCWEVAEHLPADSAETLCDTLARHLFRPSGRLFFTAAHLGQRGPGHINCQPKEYWRGLLEARGLNYQDGETQTLAKLWTVHVPKAWWYGKNLQVFAWA